MAQWLSFYFVFSFSMVALGQQPPGRPLDPPPKNEMEERPSFEVFREFLTEQVASGNQKYIGFFSRNQSAHSMGGCDDNQRSLPSGYIPICLEISNISPDGNIVYYEQGQACTLRTDDGERKLIPTGGFKSYRTFEFHSPKDMLDLGAVAIVGAILKVEKKSAILRSFTEYADGSFSFASCRSRYFFMPLPNHCHNYGCIQKSIHSLAIRVRPDAQ